MTFVLSDGRSVNNHGFRILLSGMDLDRFKRNPVMLYQHDAERIIGSWDNIRIEDNRLLADAVFDMEDATAKDVCRKVEGGFLKGCSIGIMIEDMHEIDGTLVATRCEIFEASIVSVPADAGAVRLYDRNRQELSADALYLQFQINKHNTKMNEERIKELEAQLSEKEQAVSNLTASVESLTAEVKTLREEKVRTLLDAAVESGKISESEKAQYEVLASKDYETVSQLIASMRVPNAHQSLAATLHNPPLAGQAGDRSGWSYLDWAKRDPKGLTSMRADEPERYASLLER